MFTDTHAHLYSEYYDNIEDVIKKASSFSVNRIISAGCDRNTNKETIDTISRYQNVYGAIGIHPEYANDYKNEDLVFIENNLNNKKIIAIGEIGLDYHYENFDKEKEIILFEKQLDMAEKNNMPVVVHSRDATKDTLDILKKYHLKGVIHAFSGSKETALEYIKLGFKLGVGGVVTFKNSNLKEVYKEIGIDNIILETDSPYLSPDPFRGQKNEPKNVYYVAKFLSEYLNISMEEIEKKTNKNIEEIFDIKQ